ncbi:hypothetical protein Tco_0588640 [Tanacetum coccineum]
MERAATTASSLDAEQDSGNINRTQSMATLNESFPQGTDSEVTLGSGEDIMKLLELMELCTKLSDLVSKKKILVYVARHLLTIVRHKLMLPGITSYCWKPEESNGFEEIIDFLNASYVQYALTVNPTIYTTCIEQFWTFAKLDDADGTDCLPTATIFAKLERMGAKTTSWNEFSSTMASAIICLTTNQKFNLSKYIFDNMVKNLDGGIKFLIYPRFVQVFLDKQVEGMYKHKEVYVTPFHSKKVFANMKRPCKGFSRRVTPLFSTMMVKATKDMGADSSTLTDSYSTPIITQPSSSKPQKKKSRRKQRKDSAPTEPTTEETTHEEHVSTPSYDPPPSGEVVCA